MDVLVLTMLTVVVAIASILNYVHTRVCYETLERRMIVLEIRRQIDNRKRPDVKEPPLAR